MYEQIYSSKDIKQMNRFFFLLALLVVGLIIRVRKKKKKFIHLIK
jgi:hypothetical protein